MKIEPLYLNPTIVNGVHRVFIVKELIIYPISYIIKSESVNIRKDDKYVNRDERKITNYNSSRDGKKSWY